MRLRSTFLVLTSFALLLAGPAWTQSAKNGAKAGAQTFSGAVSDSMCGKKHMMGGSSDAQCTRACVKDGSDYVLVDGDKVYTLKGDKAAIDKFAGQQATVTGKLNGQTIQVASITGK